jgi:DNA-binding GntR family transcriptional regulator
MAVPDPTPLYFRLRNVLLSGIESLAYAAGRLPGERELAAQFGVSRTTVRQALDLMAREGLVRRARGRRGGTFVCAVAEPAPRTAGSFESLFPAEHVRRIEVLACERRPGTADLCAALHLPPGSEVQYVERVLIGRGGPIAHDRAFLPVAIGARLRRVDLQERLLHDLLVDGHGMKAAEVRHEVEARLADSVSAQRLGIGVGRPVLMVRRTLLAPGDEPIYVSTILVASDRHTVRLRQRWT